MKLRILGAQEAAQYLEQMGDGAKALRGYRVLVGSGSAYARRQEYEHRTKRRYLRGALDAERAWLKRELPKALPKGPQDARRVLLTGGHRVERGAKTRVPVDTGALRRSVHTVEARRG